ncbi:MAG: KEOPS complex subunit Cgi121 [Ferroplasma sp.]
MQYKISYFSILKFDENFIKFNVKENNIFQLLDSKCLKSEVQIIEAIRKTVRYTEHSHRIRIPGNVLLIYISGTNQIESAISRCGINSSSTRGAIVYSGNEALKGIIESGYIKIIDRFIPFDIPDKDFEIFSKMAYMDLTLHF